MFHGRFQKVGIHEWYLATLCLACVVFFVVAWLAGKFKLNNRKSLRLYCISLVFPAHRIHVWYIHLHLAWIYGKCIGKYAIHGSYGLWIVFVYFGKCVQSSNRLRTTGSHCRHHLDLQRCYCCQVCSDKRMCTTWPGCCSPKSWVKWIVNL